MNVKFSSSAPVSLSLGPTPLPPPTAGPAGQKPCGPAKAAPPPPAPLQFGTPASAQIKSRLEAAPREQPPPKIVFGSAGGVMLPAFPGAANDALTSTVRYQDLLCMLVGLEPAR